MRSGVAISGKAGAGKDTFAAILSDELFHRGVWAQRVGFADELKEQVAKLYGLTKDMPGGREKLIEYSNSVRSSDPAFWIRHLEVRCDSLSPYGVVPIVSDVRYDNELAWARQRGYVTVRLDATMIDRAFVLHKRGEEIDLSESSHVCETQLDEATFDVRFHNPHGDHGAALHRYAVRVADLLEYGDDPDGEQR